MAMDKTSMANRIKTNIQARNSNLDAPLAALLLPYLEDICDGVIEEMKANMEVQTTVTVPGGTAGTDVLSGTGQETSIS